MATARGPGPVPQDALDFFKAKQLKVGFDYRDVWREEHAHAFTVAKMTQLSMLRDTQDSLAEALANGTTFRDWAKQIRPELERKGWWGVKERIDPLTGKKKLVQLGSVRRLKVIYNTNMRTARAAGQWQRIQRTKETLPYLLYQLGPSEHHREQHVAWEGLLLSADDGFWDTHMPPLGYGCKCWVRQVDRGEHDELVQDGYQDPLAPQEIDPKTGLPTGRRVKQKRPVKTTAPKTRYKKWVNKRTGEVSRVPVGITPGFDFNPGKARAAKLRELLGSDLNAAAPATARAATRQLVKSEAMRAFLAKPQGSFPVAVLPRAAADAPQVVTLPAALAQKKAGLKLSDWALVQDSVERGVKTQEQEGRIVFRLEEAGVVSEVVISESAKELILRDLEIHAL